MQNSKWTTSQKKGTEKKLGSSYKYSKQTNCLTGQGNVIQDNILITY